jgi:hypothetical protein
LTISRGRSVNKLAEGGAIGISSFDYEVEAPQSDLNAGVRTDGVITFGKVDPSQPLQVRFEWYSDNYNVTPKAIVFQVAP